MTIIYEEVMRVGANNLPRYCLTYLIILCYYLLLMYLLMQPLNSFILSLYILDCNEMSSGKDRNLSDIFRYLVLMECH